MKAPISNREIRNSSLTGTVVLTSVGLLSTLAIYFLLSRTIVDENNGVITFMATILGFGFANYFLLVKMLSGISREASERGVEKGIQ